MKLLHCILILFVALSVQAQEISKRVIISPDGEGFTVTMPQPVSVVMRDVRLDDGLGTVRSVYESEENDIRFFAFTFEKYKQLGQPIIYKKFETISKGLHYSLLNGTAKNAISITDKKDFKLNGKQVKEFSFQTNEKNGIARLYDGDENYIALVVLGSKDIQDGAKNFFESLQFINANSKLDTSSDNIKKLASNDSSIKSELWKIYTPPDYKKIVVSRGWLNPKILNPEEVKPSTNPHLKGEAEVKLKLLVDESGKVISAEAIEGHPLLRTAAVNAAIKAKFEPMTMSGNPIKFDGWITIKFQN